MRGGSLTKKLDWIPSKVLGDEYEIIETRHRPTVGEGDFRRIGGKNAVRQWLLGILIATCIFQLISLIALTIRMVIK
jgi:hypothetical protein